MARPWSLLLVFVGFAVAANAVGQTTPNPQLADRVADLVQRLGDDDFSRRQAAQKQLTDLGPSILPILNKLEPFGDPEVASRVSRIRVAIGGVAEEIRKSLESDTPPPSTPPDGRWDLQLGLHTLIVENQPKAGDFLLSVVVDPQHRLRRPAVNAFVQTWDTMTAEQISVYLRQTLAPIINNRPTYPRGVDAAIELGYYSRGGWGGSLASGKQRLGTETTHYLDGQQYGDPYRATLGGSASGTGWVKTNDLTIGRHTVSSVVKFETDHGGKPVTGSVGFDAVSFEVLPGGTPDDLVASKNAEVEALVRSALRIVETENDLREPRALFRADDGDWWRPQVTWKEPDGKPNGLHVPVWRLEKPLPVDLCFAVTIRVEGTQQEFEGRPLIAYQGSTRRLGYVTLTNPIAFAKGRTGFVPVHLALTPSRSAALTDPKVTRYFPGEIVTDVLRMKVGPPTPSRESK